MNVSLAQIDPFGELRKGWRNLAAASVGIGLGIASYAPVSSLFLAALEREFGWSKIVASGALVALPIAALSLPLAGWLADRFGVRIVSGVSAAGIVLSYLWLSRMSGAVKEFYFGLICLNVLGCATGPVAYTRLIAVQFKESRGTAFAISLFGIAFLSILMPQIIGLTIAGHGWRAGYIAFAATATGGAIAAQLLMQPSKIGSNTQISSGVNIRAALSSKAFWILGAAILAISTSAFGIVTQFQSILADRGIEMRTATFYLSLLAFSVMISRLIVGRTLDLPRPERWAAAAMLVASAGAALFLADSLGPMGTAVAVFLLAFSIGAELDLMSFFCARQFGPRHYAAIYGLLSVFFYAGIALGSVTYGASKSMTGSFAGGILCSTLLLVIAAGLFLILGSVPVSAAALSRDRIRPEILDDALGTETTASV